MNRHRLDLFSLLSGLTLIAIAVVALTGISLDVARWVWPGLLIGIGVLILTAVLSSGRDASGDADAAADAAADGAADDAGEADDVAHEEAGHLAG